MNEPEPKIKPNVGNPMLHGMLWFVFVVSAIGCLAATFNDLPRKEFDQRNLTGATAAVCLTISLVGLAIVDRIRP